MKFIVRAMQSGSVVVTDVHASSAAEAARTAVARGAVLLSVQAASRFGARGWTAPRAPSFALALFSQELLALLNAGLNLVESLDVLAEKETRTHSRHILDRINADIRAGLPLSTALSHHPEVFPELYVAAVRSSERTGAIAEALGRYVAYQQRIDTVRKKLFSASIYPALLLIVGTLVCLFLLVYVVPRFSAVFEASGAELPFMSQLLVDWGQFMQRQGGLAAGVLLALSAIAALSLSRRSVRSSIEGLVLRIPAFGSRMRTYQLARFYRTLGMLLRGGVPVLGAFDMARGLLRPQLQRCAEAAVECVRQGIPVSTAASLHGIGTPVAIKMLRVGERTGRLGDMMENIAAFHDEEIEQWVERFTRLFEPLLMMAIGIVVGGIVLLMYFPIFELAASLQ